MWKTASVVFSASICYNAQAHDDTKQYTQLHRVVVGESLESCPHALELSFHLSKNEYSFSRAHTHNTHKEEGGGGPS
jgi:hypothetical protein